MRGHVRKRGSKWCFVVELPRINGKRTQKWYSGYDSQDEAEKEMIKILNEINKGTLVIPDDSTLKEYLESWLEGRTDELSPTTISGYKTIIDKHLVPAIGDIKLSELKPLTIQRYYSRKELSSRTLLHHHRLLRKALEDARKWEMIYRNPCDLVNAPKPKNKFKGRVLDPDEIKELLAKLEKNDLYIPVVCLLSLGLRRGELLGLKWTDIDFINKTVSIQRNVVQTTNGDIIVKDPKNETSARTLPLSDRVIKLLKKKKIENKENQLLIKDYKDTGFIFTEPNGEIMNPRNFSHRFRYFIKHNNFEKLRLHDLRHTNATMMLSSGVPAKVASKRLGHSNISTTMDIYSHVLNELNLEATQKLEKKMFK
ncbi:MAG: tyrosine-type recombinase/integrase [Bacillota bacterium]|nr:tyrosine-type recombinase/integrase [Bacillota bacterium]